MDDNEILKNLGLKLKYRRLQKGMTQEILAEMVEVHEKYISKIETGKQNITIKTLNRIANSLEIDITSLLIFD
ncbi:MAG: helix-turn-helix transcriptional regulator [Candidatus Gastranaerophilales bacterium]